MVTPKNRSKLNQQTKNVDNKMHFAKCFLFFLSGIPQLYCIIAEEMLHKLQTRLMGSVN